MKNALLLVAFAMASLSMAKDGTPLRSEKLKNASELREQWKGMSPEQKREALKALKQKKEHGSQSAEDTAQEASRETSSAVQPAEKDAVQALRKERQELRREALREAVDKMTPEQREALKAARKERKEQASTKAD